MIFPRVPNAVVDNVSEFIKDYSARRHFYGQVTGVNHWPSSLNTEGYLNNDFYINLSTANINYHLKNLR